MARKILLVANLPDDYVRSLEKTYIDESYFDQDKLITGEDVDVVRPDGSPLLIFRHKVLPDAVCRRAYSALREAAQISQNRGTSSGGRSPILKKDGTFSKVTYTKPVLQGIIGFFDRTVREPYCRTTTFTARQPGLWRRALSFAQAVNEVFRIHCPERYAAQLGVVQRTPPEWIIKGTVFTTITINNTHRTTVHVDKGDYKPGFGVMSVLESHHYWAGKSGRYEGCFTIFPKWRIAVDMRSRDVCLADVHEFHANSPITGIEGEYERLATILYYRRSMRRCGTPAEELTHLKNRKLGDSLY